MNISGYLQGIKFLSKLQVLMIDMNKTMQYVPFALFTLLIFAWMVIAYRMGDWRNWKAYYPTILFFWCGDLIYNIVFYKKPLWIFVNPVLSHLYTDFLCAAVIFTCTVLVFLPNYPEGLFNKVKYLGFWIVLYSSIEWIFYLMGSISYNNGWNLKYSIIHNTYQFILLRIHYKNPILAWLLALTILVIVANIFNVTLAASPN